MKLRPKDQYKNQWSKIVLLKETQNSHFSADLLERSRTQINKIREEKNGY